jgi:CheY-like chemotaxis protein
MPGTTTGADLALRESDSLASHAHSTWPSDPASVNALIGAFETVLRGAAGCGIRLRLGLADSVDRIAIDATQFKTALLNLVTNARESMGSAGDLTISTRLVDDRVGASPPLEPGLYAAICVSDSGCGIPEDALDHVFEPFFSGHASSHNAGLGLSQVYGFATQSGGGVGIESTERKGTRVTIYLPLMAPAAETSGCGGLGVTAGTRTVLLVDDDEHVRGSTSDAIEMLGYRVIAEASAAAALERLKQEPGVDILFTDIVLPKGMSGVALAREARALRPDLRILLASGHAREALRGEAGDEMDGFAFLAKPYRLQELGAALKALGPAAA